MAESRHLDPERKSHGLEIGLDTGHRGLAGEQQAIHHFLGEHLHLGGRQGYHELLAVHVFAVHLERSDDAHRHLGSRDVSLLLNTVQTRITTPQIQDEAQLQQQCRDGAGTLMEIVAGWSKITGPTPPVPTRPLRDSLRT